MSEDTIETVRVCRECGEEYRPDILVCADCGGEGYRGRLAIVEVLISSPDFERSVASGEAADKLAELARAGGMRSLWESGMAHVERGHTSHAELLRVASPPARVDGTGTPQYLTAATNREAATPMSQHDEVVVRVVTVDVFVIRPTRPGSPAPRAA